MLTIVRERVFSASGMGKKTFRFVGRCFLARWAFRAEESFITSSSVAMVSLVGALVFVLCFSLLSALVFFSFAQLCHLRREFGFFFFFGPAISSDKGSCIVLFSIHSLLLFFVGFLT
jgi:hypothetical protein